MSDLISRSALIEEINNLLKSPYANFEEPFSKNKSRKDGIETVLQVCVGKAPMAYDVEKVVAELEKVRMNYFLTIANTRSEKLDFAYANVCTALDKAIDIVKRGGVDEC